MGHLVLAKIVLIFTMSVLAFHRVLIVSMIGIVAADDTIQYNIPDVTIQVFKPKGFRATLPDAAKLALFVFQGIVKRGNNIIDVAGETASPINTEWVVDLPDVKLNVGDEISYLIFAAIDSAGYVKDDLTYKVTELIDFIPLQRSQRYRSRPCEPTVTRVQRGTVCAGETIFEDHFDSLREELWQVQQYVPIDHPELPFVSYQPSSVSTKDGHLRIAPVLQQTQPSFKNNSLFGALNLDHGCTAEQPDACHIRASDGCTIIPPVVSGRVISKPAFAFIYGVISVRAKLPQGDWIYPEILLEPLMKRFVYDTSNSGILKIASARGNRDLKLGATQYGNKVLYSGPVVDTVCHGSLLKTKISDKFWGDGFHIYSAKWTPERLTLYVDDVEYARVDRGMRRGLPEACRRTEHVGLDPFDSYFYITLGVAVGGHFEFPDDSITKDNHAKPWRNRGSKATTNFWKDVDRWLATWERPELLVDYIKVVAL